MGNVRGQEGAEMLPGFLQDLWKHEAVGVFSLSKNQGLEMPCLFEPGLSNM